MGLQMTEKDYDRIHKYAPSPFNGKREDWTRFSREFTSMLYLKGYNEVLEGVEEELEKDSWKLDPEMSNEAFHKNGMAGNYGIVYQ